MSVDFTLITALFTADDLLIDCFTPLEFWDNCGMLVL